MTLYVEWAPSINSRKGRMISLDALATISKRHDPGYMSVYAFNETDARSIMASESSGGLSKYPVSANFLILDLDNGDEALNACRQRLDANGLGYDVYSSGGKGYHVCIPHASTTSIDLPYSHKKAVERLGIDADMSLYQHGRLISMTGRVHKKTGKKKEYLYSIPGKNLDLILMKAPEVRFSATLSSDLNALATGLSNFMDMTHNEPSPGNRHTRLWGAAKDLAAAGLEYDTILDIALKVNEGWKNPKLDDEVQAAVQQAVGR